MSFTLPDLVVESVIRDGLANLVKNPSIIDDIFGSLLLPYNRRKYGENELSKIKNLILKQQISVVHSYAELATKVPCYSIQLGSDIEDKRLAKLGDFDSDVQQTMTDPEELANLVIVDNIVVTSYESLSGKVLVPDSVDVSKLHKNLLFVDAAGTEFVIKSGFSNEDGNKYFFIDKHEDPDISDFCLVKSSLNYKQFEILSVTGDTQILIGVHTKDALTTKYLYTLLKYFMLSRKGDLIRRNFIVSSWQGSDFTRNMEYQGDMVYTRFLTATGKIEDSWNGDDVELIDDVSIQVLVPKDEATAEDLDEVNFTVKPGTTPQST